ncbi:MAG: hypothetical protein ACI9P5_003063 [Saprospiraceae bacterium]|jgi:hypothetical protein|tara:strand:- start:161 stop:517 length:357 start_codon:yes stop_codon:yes gene_type:complete
MKRRTFLIAAGTVGRIGVASSAASVTPIYRNINTSVLLSEFISPVKIMLDKLVDDVTENIMSLGLDSKIAKRLAIPVHIISKDSSKGNQRIVYKNKAGQIISISTNNNIEKVTFLQSA